MEMGALRWILLALAILLLLGVYWFGRRRTRNSQDDFYQHGISDVPSFSAKDNDEWQHGVGPVKLVSRREVPEIPKLKPELDGHIIEPTPTEEEQITPIDQTAPDLQPDQHAEIDSKSESDAQLQSEAVVTDEAETAPGTADEAEGAEVGDVIVLYLVAHRGELIKGEQLLSAAIASDLHFGDMNIFHRLDHQQQILFSLSDMMEPGNFVYENMHEHKTRGVSLFIQLNLCADPMHALDDMFICAHNLASMLDLQICDHNRQLLNESVAGSLRARAKHVADKQQTDQL